MACYMAYCTLSVLKKHQAQILDMRESPKHPEPPKFSEFTKPPKKPIVNFLTKPLPV